MLPHFVGQWIFGLLFGTVGSSSFGTFDLLYLTVCEGYGAH